MVSARGSCCKGELRGARGRGVAPELSRLLSALACPPLFLCAPHPGHQWRHFGAKYVDCHTDYHGQGVDQLAQVIHTIKTNPNDRRIIMSAWNPTDLNQMALPPSVHKGTTSAPRAASLCPIGDPHSLLSVSLLLVLSLSAAT